MDCDMANSALNPLDRPLCLSKKAAAVRQIEAAIRAMQIGDYDVAITLAGAAEGMMPETAPTGFDSMLDRLLKRSPERPKKDWVGILNRDRDWLKHLTPDLPGQLEFDLDAAAYMVFRATTKVPASAWTAPLAAFKAWYLPWMKRQSQLRASGPLPVATPPS